MRTVATTTTGASHPRRPSVALMLSAALPLCFAMSQRVGAETVVETAISVPSGALDDALLAIGRQFGTQIAYASEHTATPTLVEGFAETLSLDQALRRVLAEKGLSYRINADNAVVILPQDRMSLLEDGAEAEKDSVYLPMITLNATGEGKGKIYDESAATDYIDEKTIERFRGQSPADMFRGVPGVMSGE
ncbi:MAG: STN domain-containing protein, partial [Paracoccus sp. (in: a-proteobacteria)]